MVKSRGPLGSTAGSSVAGEVNKPRPFPPSRGDSPSASTQNLLSSLVTTQRTQHMAEAQLKHSSDQLGSQVSRATCPPCFGQVHGKSFHWRTSFGWIDLRIIGNVARRLHICRICLYHFRNFLSRIFDVRNAEICFFSLDIVPTLLV